VRPSGLRPGEAIDELVVGELLEPLQCEGRACATALTPRPSPAAGRGWLAQHPFPPGAVVAVDAHRGIQRETPAVVPAGHVARIG